MSKRGRPTTKTLDNLLAEARTALITVGLEPPEIPLDREGAYRFSTNGKPRDDGGWLYASHGTGSSGLPWLQVTAGDARKTGDVETPLIVFKSWECDGWKLSKKEVQQLHNEQEEHRKALTAHQQESAEKTSQRAASDYQKAKPATARHGYLKKKGIKPHGLRALSGSLLVPVRDINGKLWSLQSIDKDGNKRFLPGGRIKGNFALLGEIRSKQPVYLCEGWATGASIHELTGAAVVVAFNAGNLAPVAAALYKKYPEAQFLIAGDDDHKTEGNPGRKKAEMAAAAIHASTLFPRFADPDNRGTDWNDLHSIEGAEVTTKQLKQGLKPWHGCKIPAGFLMLRDGVYHSGGGGDDEHQRVSGFCWVSAMTRSLSNDWGVVLHWIDRDGEQHQQAIPTSRLHEQGPALAQEMAGAGLQIIPGKENKFRAYLASFDPKSRIRSTPTLGWVDGTDGDLVFVLADDTLTPPEREREPIIFQPESGIMTAANLIPEGTLKEWKENVAKVTEGNPYLVLSLCVAFAAPLLKHARMEGGGIHFYSLTSRGKTTGLQVAASVWGNGSDSDSSTSIVRKWNTTGNALEAIAASHNDLLLPLDEIGTFAGNDFGKVVYNLAGGMGKAALNANRSMKAVRTWRTLFLSTGEMSISDKIREGGHEPKGGQLVRVVDISIPEDQGMITDPHGREINGMVKDLKRACGHHYGTAGAAFLRHLIDKHGDSESLRNFLTTTIDEFTDRLTSPDESPEVKRVIGRFALLYVAGGIAAQARILPYGADEVLKAVQTGLHRWKSENESLSDVDRGVEALRQFLLTQASRIRDINRPQDITVNLLGYRDGEDDCYYLTGAGLKEATEGYSMKMVFREVVKRGWAITPDDSTRLQCKKRIPQKSGKPKQIRLYGIKGSFLEGDI